MGEPDSRFAGTDKIVTAAEMTDALVQINDRLAAAAGARGSETATFFCECGECLADGVPLSLDEHEEIRAREDLIFAPGHDTTRRYRRPRRVSTPASSPLPSRLLFSPALSRLSEPRAVAGE